MSFLEVANNAKSQLEEAIVDASSSITLRDDSYDTFPVGQFHVTVWNMKYITPSADPNMEIIKVTGDGTAVLTIDARAQEGTSQSDHAVGDKIGNFVTAELL